MRRKINLYIVRLFLLVMGIGGWMLLDGREYIKIPILLLFFPIGKPSCDQPLTELREMKHKVKWWWW